ncbi:MgtC/SapB family protein [Desulfosporosinus sp. BICA1-9]|uniref:MgtC/SapB family protein n=1 Tax=Desulfosporosinus sp. BICA1-9 TaxID=1531958 RepID=UPI00054B7219|nr:MgtC/SapB family protein [Desulfosporosinus sp. BICA1-9]KJS46311.1 MAG: Mg2+ transporter-C family protein [Peptococcaceae bacterium BRH_c23]KJS84458.1 MAG: Mg2+ transporter-C family protein [Desulfosporosinus sp. BICA1-9]HBW34315.1 MgtC/SapB family protein [Desulfosporosinus sp.]
MYITDYEVALRLFLACVFGGVVGLERERNDSPAGFRTHILVSLGAALIMIISMYGFSDFDSVNKDPARLAAQVVSGIGFLGAGTILRDKTSIKGLTTAASLWVVSAIGLAAGAGFYFSAFVATVLVFLTLERSVETYFFRNSQTLKVVAVNGTCKLKEINHTIESHSIIPQNISMTLLKEEANRTHIEYKLRTPFRKINIENLIADINEIDGIYSAEKVENSGSLFINLKRRLPFRKKPKDPSM